MNATGNYILPGLIFPRKNMKEELMDRVLSGSVPFTQEKGWINMEVLLKCLKYFVKHARPTIENKFILLLDCHRRHKNLEALTYTKIGIILFGFPPHYTHRNQQLDVYFFEPLTTYYNQELCNLLKKHSSRVVVHYQVAGILREAYRNANASLK